MNILITGSSGFIGFHLSTRLSKKNLVFGIDNHNNYYSKKIKNKRLSLLKKIKNFTFKKVDLQNKRVLRLIFKKFQPDIVIHLAGQPGVLYSFKNPKSYKLNNELATKNICQITKEFKIKKFIFASSSSIYGDQNKFPIKENFKLNPKNPYAITKLNSEKIVKKFFKNKDTKFLIFRFFTVYGPYGRPDMFIHKLLDAIKYKKKIKLYNQGKNFRDFTYIDDVTNVLEMSIKKKMNGEVYNICRSNPVVTNDLVKMILDIYKNKKIKFENTNFVKGEMLKTHGCNKKLKKYFKKIKFSDLKYGLKKTIDVYKKFSI